MGRGTWGVGHGTWDAGLALNPSVGMDRVLTPELSLAPHGYSPARAATFYDELARRAGAHPAVASIAYSVFDGGMTPQGSLVVDAVRRRFPTIVRFTAVDARYFRTMGISVTAGRDFSSTDRGDAPRVTIVSASLARLLANGGSALGRRITMPSSKAGQPRDVMTVVGIGLGTVWTGGSMIRAFLFEVRPLDLATLVGVSLAIVVVTAAAALGPAIRAARLDVPNMLRHESRGQAFLLSAP